MNCVRLCLVGIVTGGNYENMGNGKECLDYSFPTCAHHVPPTPGHPACPKAEYKTKPSIECNDKSYPTPYKQDKIKGTGEYAVRGVTKIMQDLMANGPQAVAFTVYTDFETYKSGVYTHKIGKMAGGHAVEFVGWGVENGVDYWLVKNSWNAAWGDGALLARVTICTSRTLSISALPWVGSQVASSRSSEARMNAASKTRSSAFTSPRRSTEVAEREKHAIGREREARTERKYTARGCTL